MNTMKQYTQERPIEVWFQTNFDSDLWEAENGLIVNTSALDERGVYFDVSRVPSGVSLEEGQSVHASA